MKNGKEFDDYKTESDWYFVWCVQGNEGDNELWVTKWAEKVVMWSCSTSTSATIIAKTLFFLVFL